MPTTLESYHLATASPPKVLSEDRLLAAVQSYVSDSLGAQFTESPPSLLPDIYHDSTPATPIIFILSQGADPTSSLTRFGETLGRRVQGRDEG